MVAVPTGWGFRWSAVQFATLHYPLKKATPLELLQRLRALSRDVVIFAQHVGATHILAEAVPIWGYEVITLAKLRCAVDLAVYSKLRKVVGDAQLSTVRTRLLGYVPKDPKEAVARALQAIGDPFENNDERDAFAVANQGLYELDAPHYSKLLGDKPAKPPKPKKPRKGKAGALALPGVV